MFVVRRLYATDRDVDEIRKAYDPEHNKHLLKYSSTVVSAAILDDANNRIGGISISDTSDRVAVERYVNDDPFTIHGMFASIEIEEVDLYKLDGSYNRAPEWFATEMKRRQDAKNSPLERPYLRPCHRTEVIDRASAYWTLRGWSRAMTLR